MSLHKAMIRHHGNCAYVDPHAWTWGQCPTCEHEVLVPRKVVVGSSLIGFLFGFTAAVIAATALL